MLTTIFTPFPYLETERLSLWQLEKADAADMLVLRSDARVNRYIDRRSATTTVAEAEAFIENINDIIAKGNGMYWAVAERQTNKFLGTICLWNMDHDTDKVELGYELLYDEQGKGYMKEAIPKVIEFAFTRMNAKTIKAVIKEGNERSIKLVDTLGFTLHDTVDHVFYYRLQRPE